MPASFPIVDVFGLLFVAGFLSLHFGLQGWNKAQSHVPVCPPFVRHFLIQARIWKWLYLPAAGAVLLAGFTSDRSAPEILS